MQDNHTNSPDIKGIHLLILFLAFAILMVCTSQFFLLTSSFAFLDNEELYLMAKWVPNFFEYVQGNMPYSVANLTFMWLPGEYFGSDLLTKYRLPSMLMGGLTLFITVYVAFLFSKSYWTAILCGLWISFSSQVQMNAHWGISSPIGAIGFSIVVLYYFYYLSRSIKPLKAKDFLICGLITLLYLFFHSDLLVQLFSLSVVVTCYWFWANLRQHSMPVALGQTLKATSPFWLFPIGFFCMIYVIPEMMKNVGIRPHQRSLFFSTSNYSGDISGFLSFYSNGFFEVFRRTLLNNVFQSKASYWFYLLSEIVFIAGFVSCFFDKIQSNAKPLRFIYSYIFMVVLVLFVLNIFDLHQLGLPRYSLYLIVPIIIAIVLSFAGWIIPITNALSSKSQLTTVAGYSAILLFTLFALAKESTVRLKSIENNQKVTQLLRGDYDLVLSDSHFMAMFQSYFTSHGETLRALGQGTPNRVKQPPDEALTEKLLNSYHRILAVTAFVPVDTKGDSKSWGYEGYELIPEHYCKSSSDKSGRLLLEVWKRCK
ncbi:MAG: hypothetical protein ACI8WB_003179 [Phenylobacterium sp.]|jgi:hypothetical protein